MMTFRGARGDRCIAMPYMVKLVAIGALEMLILRRDSEGGVGGAETAVRIKRLTAFSTARHSSVL